MVPTVRESQGKIRESEKVWEFKSTRVKKLTKVQKKILNCCTQTAHNISKLFLLFSLADYVYRSTSTFRFVSPALFIV